ncbi:MAG: NRDE family protein [Acidobacteriota bacterium]|jgi:uncharacterized protein with NRDE domain
MCLLLIAHKVHPDFELVIAANRDETYDRPTEPARFWSDAPNLLAGRDLMAGGTWLGVTKEGRIAGLTNYREPGRTRGDAPSRGHLVENYLKRDDPPPAFLDYLKAKGKRYNGFAMLFGVPGTLFYTTNRNSHPRELEPGVHGLSNSLLDTPWPKVEKGRRRLREILESGQDQDIPTALFTLLHDREIPPDGALPVTGVGPEWERKLAPLFVQTPEYGTRCSTLVLARKDGTIWFEERTWRPGDTAGPVRTYDFKVERTSGSR